MLLLLMKLMVIVRRLMVRRMEGLRLLTVNWHFVNLLGIYVECVCGRLIRARERSDGRGMEHRIYRLSRIECEVIEGNILGVKLLLRAVRGG